MTDTSRLVRLSLTQIESGKPGYRLENPFGDSVQVLPRPPSFRATIVLEWEGAPPEDVERLFERARSVGLKIETSDTH